MGKSKFGLWIKKYTPFILFGFFLLLAHLPYILQNKSILIFYGDSYQEELYLYLGGWEKFHRLDFSLWDWTLGYGANYFSKAYNYATSPFFWITLLFKKEWIPTLFLYLNALKLTLLFLTSLKWLTSINRSQWSSTIGAFLITFSGWVIFYYHYNFFLDAFLLYPLILWSVERYFKHHKPLAFILGIAALAIINFYFFYNFIPFLLIYTLFRYVVLNPGQKLETTFKEGLRWLGWFLLGIGCASFILWPSLYVVLSEPRIQDLNQVSLFSTIRWIDVYRYLSTLYSPVMERFDPSYFISVQYDNGIGWSGGVSLFTSLLVPLMLPLLWTLKDKRHRNLILLVYGLFIVFFAFKIFYRLFNGSMDVRWFYMFMLFNVYVVTELLDKGDFSHLRWSWAFNLGMLIALYLVSRYLGFFFDDSHHLALKWLVVVSMIALLAYSVAFQMKQRQILVLGMLMVELILAFWLPLLKDPPMTAKQLESYLKDVYSSEAIDLVQSQDKGFYRILYDCAEYTSQNEPSAMGYAGTSFYLSVYNFEMKDFYARFSDTFSVPAIYGRTNTDLLTSVKYFISRGNHSVPFGFEYVGTEKGHRIYRNRYYIELGWTQSKSLNERVFSSLSHIDQDRLMLDTAIVDHSENEHYSFLNDLRLYADAVYEDDYYLFRQKGMDQMAIYIEVEGSPKIEIEAIRQQRHVHENLYRQQSYLSQFFTKDDQIDALNITVESKAPYRIYLDEDLSYYDRWYQEKKGNSFRNVILSRDRIEADITVSNAKDWVITSIPYDRGWTLKVDGQTTSIEKVDLGFIGFQTSRGNHHVALTYVPPMLASGSAVSGLSIFVLIFLGFKKKLG